MARRLPPLNALRVFEAAARHLNFTKAAEELNVTPGAISHQIRGLEETVGRPLFRRHGRATALTEAGERAQPLLRQGLDRLAEAVEAMAPHDDSGILTISSSPSTAGRWLVPRLDDFYAEYPGIDIRIHASLDLVDFGRDRIDAAIRYGQGRYPGLETTLIAADVIAPVCSPALVDGPLPLKTPADLRRHNLIHIDIAEFIDIYPSWDMWLRAAGVDGVDTRRGSRFGLGELAIRAAIEGQGVALGEQLLVADDLAAGRLVYPFDPALNIYPDFGYYFVCPPERRAEPKIAAFRDWVLRQVAAPTRPPDAGP